MNIRYFDQLDSTNHYCELLNLSEVDEFAVFCALHQTAGIGQRGNHWESEPNKNLTFSLILHPTFLNAANQFVLTECLSLGICDWVCHLNNIASQAQKVYIKWPNDIYVGNRKLCGILTSTHIHGNEIESAVCGIGLNLNQTSFPEWIPNPVSLQQLYHIEFPLRLSLEVLVSAIKKRYQEARMDLRTEHSALHADYLQRLFRRGIESSFLWKGEPIQATILDTNNFGHLQLRLSNGELITCELKELKYII